MNAKNDSTRFANRTKPSARRTRLAVEILEERALLARLVPLTALVAGDLTLFEGEYVHSDPSQEPPIESHLCDEDHSLRIGFPRADRSAKAPPGEDMVATALGLPFHRDPVTQFETYSSQVIVGGGFQQSAEMFEFGVFGNADSASYEILLDDDIEDTYRSCSRVDQATFSAGGAAALQILPDTGEKFGDAVGIEVFASVTQLIDFEPESDPSSVLDATASFVYASGEELVEVVANDDENPASFEGVAKIGDVFAFSVGLTGELLNTELYEAVNLNAAAGGSVFIRALEPVQVNATEIPSNGPQFKDYLPGVTLVETFTIAVDASVADSVEEDGVTIAFAKPGLPSPEIERDGDGNTWTFELEMGMVPEDTQFTIVVEYEGGATQQFKGEIDIFDTPLQLELTMRPGATSSAFSDVEDLRLITGIPLPTAPAFRARIPNIPGHTRTAYRDRIDLVHTNGKGEQSTFRADVLFGATNEFQKSVGNLTAGTHSFELMPAVGAQSREVTLSNDLELLVIDLPDWIDDFDTDKDFAAGGELATVLNTPNAAGYVIQLQLPSSGSPFGSDESFLPAGLDKEFSAIFGSMKTSVGASLALTVFASLAHGTDAIVKGGKWSYEAVILGKEILPANSGTVPAGLSGVLDGMDLSFKGLGYVEKGIDLKGLMGVDTSFNLPLLNGAILFPLPIPGTDVKAKWSAALSGAVDTLTMDVVLKVVKAKSGKIEFENSSLTFDAEAHAIATLDVNAELGLFGVIPIASAVASGQFRLDLDAKLRIDLDGPVTSLDSISISSLSYGRVTPSYDIRWKVCVLEGNCEPDPLETQDKDCDAGTFGIGAALPCTIDAAAPKYGPNKSPQDNPLPMFGGKDRLFPRHADLLFDRLGGDSRQMDSGRRLATSLASASRGARSPLIDAASRRDFAKRLPPAAPPPIRLLERDAVLTPPLSS